MLLLLNAHASSSLLFTLATCALHHSLSLLAMLDSTYRYLDMSKKGTRDKISKTLQLNQATCSLYPQQDPSVEMPILALPVL